jgi:hypothetical protein
VQFLRPVKAEVLFTSPEMSLRYVGEIELFRSGVDEGVGRGFDNADLSADASRTIAVDARAGEVVSWFSAQLRTLGWEHRPGWGEEWLFRDGVESFLVRTEWDLGRSRVAADITGPGRELTEALERERFFGAPEGWSVLQVGYLVASDAESAEGR